MVNRNVNDYCWEEREGRSDGSPSDSSPEDRVMPFTRSERIERDTDREVVMSSFSDTLNIRFLWSFQAETYPVG